MYGRTLTHRNLFIFYAPHSHRSITIDDDKIKKLVVTNGPITTREKAEELDVSNSAVYLHSQQFGYVSELNVWAPNQLKEIHLTEHNAILAEPLPKRPISRRNHGWRKWAAYENVVRKRSWTRRIRLHNRHPKPAFIKRRLCFYKGIVYFELLLRSHAIDSNVYCRQLSKLYEEIMKEGPVLANPFPHDNAAPHLFDNPSKLNRAHLGTDATPPYSPDLPP